MFNCKLNWFWLMTTGVMVAACTHTTIDTSGNSESNIAQASSIPNYPPMYNVEVKVCGDIIAPIRDEQRCINQNLRLWGPVKEAKLVRTGISLPSVSAVDHKVAIASQGCYPVYSQPSQAQFYWADTIIQVNRGSTPTIEIKQTQLSNQQIYELMTNRLTSRRIATFGGMGCEPAPVN
ncbi:hypothetical protein [Nodularia sp. LEGE 04288]|uniref:hypothetical protein n=1 Tax=Nodularia sp. LEGE 04288 TaxID=1828639 RepID=UPI001D1109A0|nr:hypothetical protein [Nodularia sp. LEGE 04288]MCC2691536.1 hypothetical protein [Nodularia sp. LEGE 04288]